MSDWFEKDTVGRLPRRAAERWPERTALVFEERRWTFAELDREVDRAAKALLALGVERGDHLALWMTNRPEWVVLMYAVAKVGAVLVPLNTRYRTEDVGYTVRQSNARWLLSIDRSGPVDYAAMLREVLATEEFPDLREVVLFGDPAALPSATPWTQLLASGESIHDGALRERAASVDPDDLLVIAYTSGTTGDPKGAMHGHCAIRNVLDCANRLAVTFDDAILNYLPLFHLYAYSSASMLGLLTGAKQVLMETFDAAQALAWIESERCTMLHGFDTHFRELMSTQASAKRDLSSLRLGTFPAGSEASAPVAERTQNELCATVSGYGMTEVWTFSALSFPTSTPEQRCHASGFPSAGYEFRIVDPETGRAQPPGVPGEIQMRGFMITRGYYRKPEATAELIEPDGWLRSGDAGLLRPDGHLQFLGRYKDMLKVGGENVAPAEIEGYLERHPSIAQVAVVGAPDARLSEVPVAYVVLKGGAAIEAHDLIAHCKGRIASFKIPRHVFFVDRLPATPTGKVKKHELRDDARRRLAAIG